MSPLKDQFIRDGYVVVPQFLSPEVLTTLRKTSKTVLNGLDDAHRAKFKATGSLCNFGDHPAYAEIVTHPDILPLLQTFGYADIRWLAGYLISKPGKAPPLFWHQDWWGWSEAISYRPAPMGIGAMYYLSDTTPANGCLRVIPGSHRRWHPLHDLPEAHGDALSRAEALDSPAFASHPDEVAVEVKAGDLVLMDSRLLHSAYANTSGAERSLLTLWYLPDYGDLPDGIRNQLYQIFARTDLDIDAGEAHPPSPLDWPEAARSQVAPLFPTPADQRTERIFQRSPDKARMGP